MYKYGTRTSLEELRPGDLFLEDCEYDVYEVIGPYKERSDFPANATKIKRIGHMVLGPQPEQEYETVFFDSPLYRLCLIRIIPGVDKQFKSPS